MNWFQNLTGKKKTLKGNSTLIHKANKALYLPSTTAELIFQIRRLKNGYTCIPVVMGKKTSLFTVRRARNLFELLKIWTTD